MKSYLLFLLFLGIGLNQKVCAQNKEVDKVKLEYIKDYNMKLDGGVSSYTYDTASLETNDYIFVIAALKTRTAFMKVVGNNVNVFVKLVGKKPVRGDEIYHHVFAGSGYRVTVETKRVSGLDAFNNLYTGTLTVEYNFPNQCSWVGEQASLVI
jgi:hypothetical protein